VITTELIQKLRQQTGAGMMDCKKALVKADGDMEKAIQILREEGLLVAAKKAVRPATEGIIASYIHAGGKVGVLLELNCETDFVARTDEFNNLAKEILLQIAAMSPQWIKREDVPADIVEKEKEIYRAQLKKEKKPENVWEKIIVGKLEKFYAQVCLLEQAYIRDTSGKQKIADIIKEAIAKLGENIVVRRFARFRLGEE